MKILFLSQWFPYPPDNGSRIRIYHLLKSLARKHDVTLLSFTRDEDRGSQETQDVLRSFCRDIAVVPLRRFRPYRGRALLGFFSSIPRSLVDTRSSVMRELVVTKVKTGGFDLLLASELGTVPYALGINSIPKVLDEVQLTVFKEAFAFQSHPLRRLRHGLTWWKLERFMRRILTEFDACTAASDREKANILSISPNYRKLAVVPNGVDLGFYSGDFGAPVPNTLVFTGALTYSANLDAMEFFLNDIFPLIKARCPDVTLRITGKTEGVALGRLSLSDEVILTGYLDDIRPCVARSWICVVPLRCGGGTRLKILEAMALGAPVVATSKGAEGLEVTPDENILIADTPPEFAAAVLRLLDDGALRAKLAVGGRRLVCQQYGWERIGQRLEQLLQEVVRERGQREP